MTITNHIRRIQDLSGAALEHVDARSFAEAHSALDDILLHVESARAHIDHLQDVLPDSFVLEVEESS